MERNNRSQEHMGDARGTHDPWGMTLRIYGEHAWEHEERHG